MRFIVTAIGSFSADCVVNSLKSAGHFVVGCDIYPSEWHAVSKDCDVVYQAPYTTKEAEYIQFLLDVSVKHQIRYVFPLTDLEIDVLNRNRCKFDQEGIVLCIPSEETLSIVRDKYALYERFKDDKAVPSIQTYQVGKDLIPDMFLPAIAKPYNGRSSEGLCKIYSLDALHSVKEKDGYIIQKMLDGAVFTVDYVRNNSTGHDFSIPREELLRTKNGAGTTVRILNDTRLSSLVSYIGNQLCVNGCVNMEFIGHNMEYYLIDINPRFSAGVAFSQITGYDMILSHLNCFIGSDVEKPVAYKEQIVTKRYKEEVLVINND